MGVSKMRESHDPAQSVLVNRTGPRRQRELMRRTNSEFTAVQVELSRPPIHANRPAGQQIACCLEDHVARLTDGQGGKLRAQGQIPKKHAPIGAHGEHPAVVADRRVSNTPFSRSKNGQTFDIPEPYRPG